MGMLTHTHTQTTHIHTHTYTHTYTHTHTPGFGGDLRLRVCLLRDSVGMLANLTFESSNLGPSLTWTTQNVSSHSRAPMDLTRHVPVKCTTLDYPGVMAPPRVWVCEHSFGNASAVLGQSFFPLSPLLFLSRSLALALSLLLARSVSCSFSLSLSLSLSLSGLPGSYGPV